MVEDAAEAATESEEKTDGIQDDAAEVEAEAEDSMEGQEGSESAPQLTAMEARKAKMEQLRKKIAASSRANRASLVEESAKAKITAREAARLEKQRKLAEALRQKVDADENGLDVERAKNWEWTIEENDNWEKKLARKARRRYKKDLDHIKPDLVSYNKQKEIAMGLPAGTLVVFNPMAGTSQ
ncbi:hypothetical protein C0991_004021, partial [Blastosporella zonata]